MLDRLGLEEREEKIYSSFACLSKNSKGRLIPEDEDNIRTCFQKDRDRIIHSKALRRLMHKTQVFLAPEGDHYRTRLTHTLEVAQVARTIARGLSLNEDLTEAIAMGHDLGHTPFGHSGEDFLNQIHPGGFSHNIQSLRVVDVIEKRTNSDKNLNLTMEVRDGIVNHSGPVVPFTLEAQCVRLSDRIAYINSDIDDALRGGIIQISDIPSEILELLGHTHGERIDALVLDAVRTSDGKDMIMQSSEFAKSMNDLREWMFEHVYRNPEVKTVSMIDKVQTMIFRFYDYYVKYPEKMPAEYVSLIDEWGKNEAAKDYISGMTDRYALNLYDSLFGSDEYMSNIFMDFSDN